MKAFTAAAIASSALLTLASAQEQYSINPDSVSSSDRDYWCQQQKTQCPLICLQPPSETATTNQNSCDADTLSYSCECGDGLRPNVTEFTQTLPFFICQEWGNQCVSNCNGDNACASSCREDHPCGAQDPQKPNSTISSTMSSTASASRTASEAGATTDSSGGTIYTGFGEASSTGDSSSQAEESSSAAANDFAAASASGAGRASMEFGHTFGVLALAGAFFGGFALVL